GLPAHAHLEEHDDLGYALHQVGDGAGVADHFGATGGLLLDLAQRPLPPRLARLELALGQAPGVAVGAATDQGAPASAPGPLPPEPARRADDLALHALAQIALGRLQRSLPRSRI